VFRERIRERHEKSGLKKTAPAKEFERFEFPEGAGQQTLWPNEEVGARDFFTGVRVRTRMRGVATEQDESDFVDRDFQLAQKSAWGSAPGSGGPRPPTREELENKVHETQQRLEELRRVQGELERERVALEEARRRRTEFHLGREEMLQHLTRGIGLLEESEFAARRDAEQMAKTLGELRDSLMKVQALNDQGWTQEDYNVELTRALTTIENARMEWNAAQLKWPALSGSNGENEEVPGAGGGKGPDVGLTSASWQELSKVGLALTWPLALVVLGGLVTLVVMLLAR
jgi:hypothetical protein